MWLLENETDVITFIYLLITFSSNIQVLQTGSKKP